MNVELSATAHTTAGEHEVANLYRAHFGYVWQVLQKLGVETSAVEDAAHDVFVVAHRRWRDFEGRSSAQTWLFAVARRVAHRYRRADFRRRRRRAALALVPEPDPPEPDALLQRKQAWQHLLTFLDELEPAYREAFVLGEIEGISRARMGRVLGISPNTAYSRLRAARRRFTEAFPSPDRRRAVRRASALPSREDKRRGWALLAAHASARPALLGGLLPAAGVVGIVAVGVVTALTHVPPSRAPASHVASAAVTEHEREPPNPEPPAGDQGPKPQRVVEPSEPDPATRTELPRRRSRDTTVALRRGPERATARPETPPTPADPGFGELDPAMASLAQARRALHRHRPHEALTLLDRSQRLDTLGAFATERAVTRVWALCATDRLPQARAQLRLLQRSGDAPAYADVLSGSCVAELISPSPSGDQEG